MGPEVPAGVQAPAGFSLVPRVALALLIAALVVVWSWQLAGRESDGRELALLAVAGLLFGIFLQRARFCFYCVTRDFLEQRDARGLLGILAALAVGTLGYHAVFGAFLPMPSAGRLPPDAHIGPVSGVLVSGAFAFGIGMALSGSCISAHLYRLGEGSLLSIVALLGAGAGFVLGFLSWNALYLGFIQGAPVPWLPVWLGYGGSLLLQLALLAALAALLLWRSAAVEPESPASAPVRIFVRRWPAYVGGILIGTLAVLVYLRAGPLGVTAELGSLARTAADRFALLPERLEGLDTFSGCATAVKETLLSANGVFVLALVAGAFVAALPAGQFSLQGFGARDAVRALAGGVLMGWGAMVALGCTIGTLLSGIMAGAVSGWIFAAAALAGLWLGWQVRRRFLP